MEEIKTRINKLKTKKEGHLYKRGKINSSWRKRYFKVTGSSIAYYASSKVSNIITFTLYFLKFSGLYC